MMNFTRAVTVLGLVAAAASDCAPSDCGAWCTPERCHCAEKGWWFWKWCKAECVSGWRGDTCSCNFDATSLSHEWLLDVKQSAGGGALIAGGWDGAYVAKDGDGRAFDRLPAMNGGVWAVAKDGDVVFAGTSTGLLRSVDGGATAETVLDVGVQGGVVMVNASYVVAASLRGAWYSPAGGADGTWTQLCHPQLNETARMGGKGCGQYARALAVSPDGGALYVVFESTATVFKVELGEGVLTTLVPAVENDAWCADAPPPFGKLCSSYTLAVFGTHLVLAPRQGAVEGAVLAYDLSGQGGQWRSLARGVHARTVDEVAALAVLPYAGATALYVQRTSFIEKYTDVTAEPVVVADTTGEHPASRCSRHDDRAPHSGNGLGLGIGLAQSPNGKYIVTATNGGAYRFFF
eukprot:TRINITY_DN25646_c0_g1_i1.p1 TRINITY_DN25646_c0_g1~~TRINITY_DN25646_c0_g1_i1.p1  ORF type:complete len:405 (+),score=81.09 TRINITY_DN25646_c0_g1_i1:46-1260(+)